MSRAERAIILAAGAGSRMGALTKNLPKPLIELHGRPMVESLIEALAQKGIGEITLVTGYLAHQFDYLEERYPALTLLHNPHYQTANNISSLYLARAQLHNAFVLDADQIIAGEGVLSPEFIHSGYCCRWSEGHTDEWLLRLDGEGIVRSCSRTGGSGGWQLYSVSMWNAEDGARLAAHLQDAYIRRGIKDLYWDDVPLLLYPEHYRLGVRPVSGEDIVEIDTLEELAAYDPAYAYLMQRAATSPSQGGR